MILYAGSAGIAILFPDVISAFAFVGGTGGVFTVVTFPMAIYI